MALKYKDMLHRNDFRFVEKLLYDQTTHETALKVLEAELKKVRDNIPVLSSTSVVDISMPKGQAGFTQPEAYAIRAEENLRVKYLEERIAERKRHQTAIKKAKESLSDEENTLVRLFYDLNKTARDCWRIMGLQKSRWYELRREVVNKVARFVGLL